MLSDEEKSKITEEEQLRMQVRKDAIEQYCEQSGSRRSKCCRLGRGKSIAIGLVLLVIISFACFHHHGHYHQHHVQVEQTQTQ